VCYRLVFASDRRLPTGRISDRVQVVPSDSTPDVAKHFATGSHFADIITVQCACDLVFDPVSADREQPTVRSRNSQYDIVSYRCTSAGGQTSECLSWVRSYGTSTLCDRPMRSYLSER